MYFRYKALFTGVVFAAAGAIVVLAGIGFLIWSISQSVGSMRTQGTVIRIEQQVSAGKKDAAGAQRIPVIEYQVGSRHFTCKAQAGSSANRLQVGDKVNVLYKTNDPSAGQVDFFAERWVLPVAIILFGSVFVIIGGIGIWAAVRWYPSAERKTV